MSEATVKPGLARRSGATAVRSARRMLRYLLLTIAVLLVLIALLTAAARIGLPYLSGYKSDLEAGLSDKLQSPVVIGTLDLRWENFGPKLRALDVRVIESEDRQVKFDELLIDLNFAKSMWARLPVMTELSLIGAELVVEQDASGRVRLHGVNVNENAAAEVTTPGIDVLSWLLKAEKVGLLDATVTLVSGDEPSLVLDGVNVRAESQGALHQLRLEMDLPEVLGGELTIGADVSTTDEELKNASGDIYVQATDLNLQGLEFLQSLFTSEGVEGSLFGALDATASVEIWGNLEAGVLLDARGQFLGEQIINQDDGRVIIDSVKSDFTIAYSNGGYALRTPQIQLEQQSRTTMLRNVELKHRTGDGLLWKLSGHGEELAIPLISELATAVIDVPWLANSTPAGELRDWRFDYAVTTPSALRSASKRRIAFTAGLTDLSLPATENTPGVNNVSGRIAVENNKGVVTLLGQQSVITFPAWYERPVEVAAFSTDLNIDLSDSKATRIAGQVSLVDTGIGSTARIKVTLRPDKAPHLDLQGGFEMDDIALLKPFLPQKVIPTAIRAWFERALVSGELNNGKVLLFGNLNEFPFDNGEGVFKVGFDLATVELAAIPKWPSFQDVGASVALEGLDFSADVVKATLAGVAIKQAQVHIEDLSNPWLKVDGMADGTVQNLLQFANNGPLKRFLKPALSDASGTGRAQMDLAVDIPLRRQNSRPIVRDLNVKGSIFLRQNTIRFDRAGLDLTNVVGAIGFTKKGLRIRNLKARALGSDVSLDGDTVTAEGVTKTRLSLSGALSAKDMLQQYKIPLDRFIKGAAQWKLSLVVPHKASGKNGPGVRLTATSDLVGSAISLPAPLNKSSAVSKRMSLETRLDSRGDSKVWYLTYGDDLSSRIVVKDKAMDSLTLRFGGGDIQGEVASGIRIDGNAAEVSLDGWARSISYIIDQLPPSGQKKPILPISVNLSVNNVRVGTSGLGVAQLQANTGEKFVNAVVRNEFLSGNLRYPRRYWKKDIQAVARIERFEKRIIDGLVGASEANRGSNFTAEPAINPTLLPPMDIRVAQLIWNQWDVKNLVLRTRPQVGGLSIDTLGFASETAQLVGEGYWRLRDPQKVNPVLHGKHITRLNLTLQSGDIGKSLTELGVVGVMDEGEGTVTASLQWLGPLYSPVKADLNGNFEIDLSRGRLLQLEPGAARLMGLFALQTLPRRISFDFKDLIQDGLDYDSIKGDIELANGVANTRLIQLTGAVGVVDITGESNILTRQFNQEITVLPRVSAALPIIGAISGGATAGVGALLAGGFLKAIGVDFDRIGLRQYKLQGKWEEPLLEPIPFSE